MANKEHLELFLQGAKVWNAWRAANSQIVPDLNETIIPGEALNSKRFDSINLAYSNLNSAHLSGLKLNNARFTGAVVVGADFRGARLRKARFNHAILADADFSNADLSGAEFTNANLDRARFNDSILTRADLRACSLTEADLQGAKLDYAMLDNVELDHTNLTGADLTEADLRIARIKYAVFGNNDLSTVKGLDDIYHFGPSTIGIDTLYRSGGKIPDKFLRECGVPDELITYLPSLLSAKQSIEFYSCFISYSHNDEEFAKRLHSRLRDARIRVWFAPEDIKGGEKLYEQIDHAIQVHDRLLVILSEHSLRSEWVVTEIRKARKTEIKEKRRKLFPIRLVDYEMIREWECFDADTGKDLAVELREYFIPDFSNWKDHESFEGAFDRLLKDLRAAEKSPENTSG